MFENDSSKLESNLQSQLKVAIPIFAEELFTDPELKEHISEINIIGHASPRWESEAVSPVHTGTPAYRANMRLSANRALAVMDYMFGPDLGSYKHKDRLGQLIKRLVELL